MTAKQDIYTFCLTFVEGRVSRIQNSIDAVQESLKAETKSSAGDKHETGRAMLQLDRESLGRQLAEAEKMKQVLSKVNLENNPRVVRLGSWVKTSKADYFLAISAGEYSHDGVLVFCISGETPIGKLLVGKSKGEVIFFRGEEIKILKIE